MSVKAQSMFHRNRTIVVDGLPEVLETESDPFARTTPTPAIPLVKPKSVTSTDDWFKRRSDGKLFKTVCSSFGRVQLQSDCGKEFDTAIASGDGGWKSISPTSRNTYCRVPRIR